MSKVISTVQTADGKELRIKSYSWLTVEQIMDEAPNVKTVADLEAAPSYVFSAADWSILSDNGRYLKITGIGPNTYQARAIDGTGDTFNFKNEDKGRPVYMRSYTG